MRFIHTADWQIGKVFRRFGDKESVLQQARLDVIETIASLAKNECIEHVLVAGDLYDNEAPSQKTLLEPLERMRGATHVAWHVIPGNHDPHRPQGIWERAAGASLPANVNLHLTPQPVELPGAVLLPAPLVRKSEVRDLTDWMDAASSPPDVVRIGMAHGSVVGFQGEGEANNPIDPDRPRRADLDYLALGDWHRTMNIGDRVWYAGTPEPDRFGSQVSGTVLLVDAPARGAPINVTPTKVGRYGWSTRAERLDAAEHVVDLENRLRGEADLTHTALRLDLTGALALSCRSDLDRSLESLGAAYFWLDANLDGLAARPSDEDIERIDFDGVLRSAADRLKALANDASKDEALRKRAAEALMELYLMTSGEAGGRSR